MNAKQRAKRRNLIQYEIYPVSPQIHSLNRALTAEEVAMLSVMPPWRSKNRTPAAVGRLDANMLIKFKANPWQIFRKGG